jgi:hypothetical protein
MVVFATGCLVENGRFATQKHKFWHDLGESGVCAILFPKTFPLSSFKPQSIKATP